MTVLDLVILVRPLTGKEVLLQVFLSKKFDFLALHNDKTQIGNVGFFYPIRNA